jgi:hypothetical protein
LTSKPFSTNDLKIRVKQAEQRRTLGYFVERKFSSLGVLSALKSYGFKKGKYFKVIVSWGWAEGVQTEAEKNGITLWDFRKIIHEIAHEFKNDRTYFTDDTLRTLHLYAAAEKYNHKDK